MIGEGWTDEPGVRPRPEEPMAMVRRIAVATGSRAEYGLLRPVMRAVAARGDLELLVIAAGSHLVQPALTYREVKRDFAVADSVPMQVAGRSTRADDVESLGRGVARFGRSFARLAPDWVVVLGDRIEAFAAAAAGSVGGFAVAHVHGGDRAEGVADEAMRHAITKLAHVHLAATEESAERIRRMGERAEHVQVVGSPALDELGSMPRLDDESYAELGEPRVVFLMHPLGRSAEREEQSAAAALEGVLRVVGTGAVLALMPNLDAGREGVVRAVEAAAREGPVRIVEHLPRARFVGLLRRLAGRGALVGNSSAALIECAALGVAAVDVGPRQAGRERAGNVLSVGEQAEEVARGVERALALKPPVEHPFGDGRAGERIAALLARVNPHGMGRKRCVY
jgi:UDP-hydrolysing UDP-N-acetyl-D-glucosamine 2-epimerase